MKEYHYPRQIKKVVCSDLDETFLPHNPAEYSSSGVADLESFLLRAIDEQSLIFGWITGSNLDAALRKTKDYISYLPHFIASSLGTEFYWVKNGKMVEPLEWKQKIENSGYSSREVSRALAIIKLSGIELLEEPQDYQGKYKSTFYYFIRAQMEEDFQIISQIAAVHHCKVLFNRCNPAAGDPENCYDVEFIPHCCGKGEVIDFLKENLSLSSEDFYAFGDSCNDFSMFSRAGHAFLVGNAETSAKEDYPAVLNENYCVGIRNKLIELL
ncbi:HAD-IIB family hydrolase [Elizabethkingia argentiflava]|uniref:HAD-IIB family hydrolase n=1 Tax=Elizabethkingia argenteiflava TaxID=2681556 RepID=A0A845PXY2_9FLAO|nr:HAD-IIB family hydrolase [Elizabethkingia argenteiflava]NAW52113.1 HAD-IIB family hydrolase [Elizabethkingia argenteiflava]